MQKNKNSKTAQMFKPAYNINRRVALDNKMAAYSAYAAR